MSMNIVHLGGFLLIAVFHAAESGCEVPDRFAAPSNNNDSDGPPLLLTIRGEDEPRSTTGSIGTTLRSKDMAEASITDLAIIFEVSFEIEQPSSIPDGQNVFESKPEAHERLVPRKLIHNSDDGHQDKDDDKKGRRWLRRAMLSAVTPPLSQPDETSFTADVAAADDSAILPSSISNRARHSRALLGDDDDDDGLDGAGGWLDDLYREDDDGIIRAPWQTKDDDDDYNVHKYRDDDDGLLGPLTNGRFVPYFPYQYFYYG